MFNTLLISVMAITQQGIPDFTAAELQEAQKKGWVLSDKTDEQGIRRRVFIEKKGSSEIRQGYFASWFKDGKPRSILHFRNGVVEGESTTWFTNGQMGSKGSMSKDKRSGPWTFWNLDGSKARTGTYAKGIEQGGWSFWYGNGKLAANGSYTKGLQSGHWEFFKPDGSVLKSVSFSEGLAGQPPRIRAIIVPPKQPPAPPMVVKVDRRMELLAVIQSMTDWPSYGAWDTYNDQYQQDVAAWFGKFKTHPAVARYNELLNGDTNFAFDVPIIWILHYSDLPEFKQLAAIPASIAPNAPFNQKLDELASLMRQFEKDTRFQEFFDAHQGFYDSLVKGYLKASPGQRGVQLVSDYYGETRSAATAIICPLFGGGNYGPEVEIKGEKLIYSVGAPQNYKNGKFSFEPNELRGLVFHEFGHSFSNPAVNTVPELKKYETALFPPIANRMSAIAYGSWSATCYELFDRTHEIRLMELSGNAKQARDTLAEYIGLGFVWLPYTLARLNEYERDRAKYPTLRSFMPRLASVLDETEMFVIDGYALCALPK